MDWFTNETEFKMKLSDLAIDEFDGCQKLQLTHLSDGLNVLYGPEGSGKTRLLENIQNTFFGISKNQTTDTVNLTVQVGIRKANLNSVCHQSNERPLEQHQIDSAIPASAIESLEKIGAKLFKSIYSLDSKNDCTTINRIVQQLRKRLGVVTGKPDARMATDPFSHNQEFQLRQAKRNAIHKEIHFLETEKNRLLTQTDTLQTPLQQTRVELDSEIDYARKQVSKTNLQPIREQIAATDAQVTKVRSQLELATAEITVPLGKGNGSTEQLNLLFAHLDDLERQMRHQREMQKTVQRRRIQLRDQMATWNELKLESPKHPYYKVWSLLRSLESSTANIVDHQNHETQLNAEPLAPQLSQQIIESCHAMQTDLRQISDELGQQYQHLRHRAATEELKQLRLQYSSLGENRSHLINRRQRVIERLQQCDPTAAGAILQDDPAYQKCAAENGHSVARRRFFGNPQSTQTPTLRPDSDRLRHDLNELQNRRQELVLSLVQSENQLGPLKARLSKLTAKRNRHAANPQHERDGRITEIDERLSHLKSQTHLLSQYESAGNDDDHQPDPLLKRAGQLADRLTLGEVTAIWIHESKNSKHFQLITEGRYQNSIPYQSLSSTAQQQTILSLCLAAVETLNGQGIGAPMLIDDIWRDLDAPRVKATFELLSDYCRQGIQVITATSEPDVLSRALRCRTTTFKIHPDSQAASPMNAAPECPVVTNTTVFADVSTPVTYPLVDYISHNSDSTSSTATIQTTFGRPDLPPQPTASTERTNHDGAVLEFAPLVDEPTPLINFDLFTPSSASSLLECGIRDVKDLLNHDPKQTSRNLTKHGFQSEDLENWQSITWLMICVPGLRIQDASLLRSIGIAEPEQLFTTTSLNLSERLHREINSSGDQSPHVRPNDYSAERLNRWYRALDRTQHRWRTSAGYSRLIRVQQSRGPSQPPPSPYAAKQLNRNLNHLSDSKSGSTRRRQRVAKSAREPELSIANTFAERKTKKRKKTQTNNPVSNKFHLDLHDHIEAAPSIGPKTAERFQKVGVSTIGEFLDRNAESMAQEIDYKRISAKVIQTWQNQTRLVCRIPNLRGHDAQLLVACGITDPELLNAMSPDKLFEIVGPFSETKAGLKIIRSGKKPDFAEISNWIDWSNQNRSLKAA